MTWSGAARAQAFLRDPRIQIGPGINVGNMVLHPGLAAELGYDSNYFLRTDRTGPQIINGNPQDTLLARVTPSIRVASRQQPPNPDALQEDQGTAPRPALAFDGGASASYREFFTGDLQNQRNVNAEADAALQILPGRVWSGALDVGWVRLAQPSVLGNPDQSYDNDTIGAGADLATQPGLGPVDWHFGYRYTATFFERSVANPFNNMGHQIYTRGRWRFRPRTAFLFEAGVTYHSYNDPTNSIYSLHTSTPVRARLGFEGLLTSRLALMGLVGYEGTFVQGANDQDVTPRDFDTVIGQLEVRFYPTTTLTEAPSARTSLLVSQIALGGVRDVLPSYLGDYMAVTRGYLRAEYFFANQFFVTLEGGIGSYEHPDLFFGPAFAPIAAPVLLQSGYSDLRADATVFAEYRFTPTLAVNGTFQYAENFSDTQLPVDVATAQHTAQNPHYTDQNWQRLQAFVGVRWLM